MKILFVICLSCISLFGAAQTDTELASSEKVAEFSSMLCDWEVFDGKLVALTKRKREYFVYFTNTNGVEVYQTLELKYLSDLFVDCMGNVYVTTIDSAYRLSIADFVQVEEGLDLPTYRSFIQNCEAIFDYTLVRSAEDNVLVVEPIDDEVYASTPSLNVIQHSSNQVVYSTTPYFAGHSSNSGGLDSRLVVDQTNAYVPAPSQTSSDGAIINVPNRTSADVISPQSTSVPGPSSRQTATMVDVNHELNGFKVGDSLWVIDRTANVLFVYSSDGVFNRSTYIQGLMYSDDMLYDSENESVYFARYESNQISVNQLGSNAELTPIKTIDSTAKVGHLMANNGFIYNIQSKGAVKSIYRTSLKINE